MTEPRFLVVRLSSLGDIVHTFPAVAALRETFPEAEISWLTHPRWNLLIESSGIPSRILAGNTKSLGGLLEMVSRIRVEHFDTAIDYQGLWKSAGLPFLGGVKTRIGFSSKTIREFGVPSLYNKTVNTTGTHIVEQNGELSLAAKAKKSIANVVLKIPEEFEQSNRERWKQAGLQRYIVLSPGGGWRSKCWLAESYGALCSKIYELSGIRCVINYGPGEESLAGVIQQASGRALPLLFNEDLGSLMALLRNAALVVGGDTGPLHLSAALNTSVVAIFGPTDPARNGPFCSDSSGTSKNIVLRSGKAVTTYERGDSPDPSLLDLSVEDVFRATVQLLEAAA
jgi:heptosyltransferase-1